jgi:peptide/nickel transport system permease protein
VLTYTLAGTHVAAVITLVASMIIVPLATAVGTTAAYVGGRVDGVLMRTVDVVQAIPPLFAYIIIRFVLGGGGDMLLLVGVFGLLSWGSAARVVRSETLKESEKSYVKAARNVGAGGVGIVQRHLLPNVSTTVISTTAHQISILILTEAALSYLELGAPHTPSWGTIIADGASGTTFGQLLETWWISVFPMVALAVTVVAISVFGDSLRDVLDPRSA